MCNMISYILKHSLFQNKRVFNILFLLRLLSEMRPCWYAVDKIPFKEMWPDDIYWFPLFLKGVKFSGYFKFEGHDNILDYSLKEVEQLPK